MKQLIADFSKSTGKIRKKLHCSGYAPAISTQNIRNFNNEFKDLKMTSTRTHDMALQNSGQRVVDTHFIFPLMHLDPKDPRNYFFKATDILLNNIMKSGSEVFYRLGTSIEHSLPENHINTIPPDNFEKYAEVLAGIIRHYNHGWAEGYHLGIKYWEIWNEPNLPGGRMWAGDLKLFHRFYGIVSKRLKQEFPEIMVGGPSFCDAGEECLRNFFSYCREEQAPLDFISWHCYGDNPSKILGQPGAVRKLADEYGFTATETILNEWHYLVSWNGLSANITEESFRNRLEGVRGLYGIDSAAYNVLVFIGFHDTPLDASFYYGFGDGYWGITNIYKGLSKNYYSLLAIGEFIDTYSDRVEVSSDTSVWVIAAKNKQGECAVLVSNYRDADISIELKISGCNVNNLKVLRLDQKDNLCEIPASFENGIVKLEKSAPESAVFLVTFTE
ncbi:MAG: hypothetical protein JXR78_13705 [Victivallales bacterium]|nr:hypothetical protein [Victivallales bacterium]